MTWIDFDPPIEGAWGTMFGALLCDGILPMDLEDDNPYRATDLGVLYSDPEPFYSDYQEIE